MGLRVRVMAALVAVGLSAAGARAALDVAIDIDTTRLSGTNTTGAIATQEGFVSWDLTNVGTSGSTITEQGVTFEIFGLAAANQSRVRASGGGGATDSLLRDFVFNEGASGRAIGLRITGLSAGSYEMQSWHYDSDVTVTSTENFIRVETRDQGIAGSTVTPVTAFPFGLEPASFSFDVTEGVAKEIIFREDDAPTANDPTDQNRARLNAFTLTIPEPNAAALLAAGALVASIRRRRCD